MDKFDKRKSPPIKIYYPISCVGLDEKKRIVEQQMGVALGISKNAMLIETPCITESKLLLVMAVDHKNNLIEIKGKAIYSELDKTQKYRTGVSFQGPFAENIEFAKKLIKAFYYQKNQSSGPGPILMDSLSLELSSESLIVRTRHQAASANG